MMMMMMMMMSIILTIVNIVTNISIFLRSSLAAIYLISNMCHSSISSTIIKSANNIHSCITIDYYYNPIILVQLLLLINNNNNNQLPVVKSFFFVVIQTCWNNNLQIHFYVLNFNPTTIIIIIIIRSANLCNFLLSTLFFIKFNFCWINMSIFKWWSWSWSWSWWWCWWW